MSDVKVDGSGRRRDMSGVPAVLFGKPWFRLGVDMKLNQGFLSRLGICMLMAGIQAPAQTVRKMPGRLKYANAAHLTGPQQQELNRIAAMVSQGQDSSRINERWRRFVGQVARGQKGELDIAALVDEVMREAAQESDEDLRSAKEKVEHYNSVKKALRDEIDSSRRALIEMQKGKRVAVRPKRIDYHPQPATAKPVATTAQPVRVMRPGTAVTQKPITTAPELKTYISELEGKLQSAGDDAQLANTDLQNALQRQQQTVQTMSNISKMLHDTAKAAISNMR